VVVAPTEEAATEAATTAVARDTSPETAPSPELSDPAAVVVDDPATTADRRATCRETAPTLPRAPAVAIKHFYRLAAERVVI